VGGPPVDPRRQRRHRPRCAALIRHTGRRERAALTPLHEEVLIATQWAQAGTALALWMLLPLLIGIWRITRQEVAS
jgi:hypothetical protein